MDDDGSSGSHLETGKAERSVWLMKCPPVVAKSWQSHSASDPHPLAKVVLSLDPLHSDDSSSLQVQSLSLSKTRARLGQYSVCLTFVDCTDNPMSN